MSFGENLQAVRKKNQLSQEGLAEMLGVSRQAVSKWELGDGYPEVDKLLLLSKRLKITSKGFNLWKPTSKTAKLQIVTQPRH